MRELEDLHIGIIGGGKIGQAIIKVLRYQDIAHKGVVALEKIHVTLRDTKRLWELEKTYNVRTHETNQELLKYADI